MKFWQKISQKFGQAWSFDTRSLSLFRVGLWIIILADLVLRSRYMIEHYTDAGVFSRLAMLWTENNIYAWTFHAISGNLAFQIILFLIHGLLAIFLIAGYRTKIMTIALWIFALSLQNRNIYINSGADDLLRMVLFWSMFLPLDRHFSTVAYQTISAKKILTIWSIAFILQQVMMYIVTAYVKLWPEWYGEQSALYTMLSLETFRTPLGSFLYENIWLMKVITNASMAVEFLSPLLLISPIFPTASRIIGIISIAWLHFWIVTHVGVGIFPFVSTISMLPFIPSWVWEKISTGKNNIKVHYDAHCLMCIRWIRFLRNFWLIQGVNYTGLHESSEEIQEASKEKNSWVITRGRKKYFWYAGFVELMRSSWLGRCFVWIWSLNFSHFIGEKVYTFFSQKRTFCELESSQKKEHMGRKWGKIIAGIICGISLYCVVGVNIAVMNCGNEWRPFFQAWPISGISLLQERSWHVFEKKVDGNVVKTWWIGEGFVPAEQAKACSSASGKIFDTVKNFPLLKKLFSFHIKLVDIWTYLPRLDQYWKMFSPRPLSMDYWFVIIGEKISKETGEKTQVDLWKEYVYGEENNALSYEKPNNLHKLSHTDRWRKYLQNSLVSTGDNALPRYFSESLCKQYNLNPEQKYTLEKLQIFVGRQPVWGPNYTRGDITFQNLWNHCCLKDGCFLPETTEE